MGEENLKQFVRLNYRLVIDAEVFDRVENLSSLITPTMSKDFNEQLKLAQNVVDVLNQANRNYCGTLLRYSVDKPEIFYAQVRLFAQMKEDEEFYQNFSVHFERQEFFYLIDIVNSVYVELFLIKPLVMSFKSSCSYLLLIVFLFSGQDELEHWTEARIIS